VTAAAHLAEYEAYGPAAVRAHLAFEHTNGVLAYPAADRAARGWTSADLHRHLHPDDESEQLTFPTEAPA
jgi:hypothetical protein